jgi:hypothetical protein
MSSSNTRRVLFGVALAACAAALGFAIGRRELQAGHDRGGQELANTVTVLSAVRGLARLETVAYHMERIIDLKNRSPRLFGLIEADDAILLVAAGDVVAGIDLAKVRDGDVKLIADPRSRRVQLRLPAPEILSARLDNQRTYVNSRKTDLLAQRGDQLETDARRLAERSIRDAALEAGVLERARQGAEQSLTTLVRGLGYDRVEFEWASGD